MRYEVHNIKDDAGEGLTVYTVDNKVTLAKSAKTGRFVKIKMAQEAYNKFYVGSTLAVLTLCVLSNIFAIIYLILGAKMKTILIAAILSTAGLLSIQSGMPESNISDLQFDQAVKAYDSAKNKKERLFAASQIIKGNAQGATSKTSDCFYKQSQKMPLSMTYNEIIEGCL